MDEKNINTSSASLNWFHQLQVPGVLQIFQEVPINVSHWKPKILRPVLISTEWHPAIFQAWSNLLIIQQAITKDIFRPHPASHWGSHNKLQRFSCCETLYSTFEHKHQHFKYWCFKLYLHLYYPKIGKKISKTGTNCLYLATPMAAMVSFPLIFLHSTVMQPMDRTLHMLDWWCRWRTPGVYKSSEGREIVITVILCQKGERIFMLPNVHGLPFERE